MSYTAMTAEYTSLDEAKRIASIPNITFSNGNVAIVQLVNGKYGLAPVLTRRLTRRHSERPDILLPKGAIEVWRTTK